MQILTFRSDRDEDRERLRKVVADRKYSCTCEEIVLNRVGGTYGIEEELYSESAQCDGAMEGSLQIRGSRQCCGTSRDAVDLCDARCSRLLSTRPPGYAQRRLPWLRLGRLLYAGGVVCATAHVDSRVLSGDHYV